MGAVKELAPTAALAAGATFISLANTATRDHRIYTHHSMEYTNRWLDMAARVAGGHLTDTKRWAAVHRVHHSTPDANLVNFVGLADYMDWRDQPAANTSGHVDLPDEVYGYDPAVESIDLDTAYEIGYLARELVGGKYQPKQDYSIRDGGQILYDKKPRYFYEDRKTMKADRKNPVRFDPDNKPGLQQIRFLLRDPHSPALHRYGIPGIYWDNVPLYGYAEQNFSDPAFLPEDLQPDDLDKWIRDHRALLRIGYVSAMVVGNVIINPKKSAARVLGFAALGAAASGIAVGGLIQGGNATNAGGHAGGKSKWAKLQTYQDILSGKVTPKPDGTYTTNSKLISPPTLDEVGGQEVHHDHPELIAYSLHEGARKLADAPYGTANEFLADHGIIFKHGDNFGVEDTSQRPDMPSEAVLTLQSYRAKKLAEIALAA